MPHSLFTELMTNLDVPELFWRLESDPKDWRSPSWHAGASQDPDPFLALRAGITVRGEDAVAGSRRSSWESPLGGIWKSGVSVIKAVSNLTFKDVDIRREVATMGNQDAWDFDKLKPISRMRSLTLTAAHDLGVQEGRGRWVCACQAAIQYGERLAYLAWLDGRGATGVDIEVFYRNTDSPKIDAWFTADQRVKVTMELEYPSYPRESCYAELGRREFRRLSVWHHESLARAPQAADSEVQRLLQVG
jgi:hypothetical protein